MKSFSKNLLSFLSTVLILLFSINSLAQSDHSYQEHSAQRKRAMERIHSIKIGYITDRLHLTSEQATNFWPIYYRYEQEIRDVRKQFFQKYHNDSPESFDKRNSRQYIDDNLDYQQQIIDIKRKYNDEFVKVISEQQLAELYKAERDFKKLLIQKLNDHRGRDHFNGGYDRNNSY